MQRCYNILLQLSRFYRLTVITFLSNEQISKMKLNHPDLRCVNFISIPKMPTQSELSIFQRIRNAVISRYFNADILEKTNTNLLRVYFALNSELLLREFDIAVVELIDLIKLSKYLKKNIKIVIYNAHNFDTELYLDMYKNKQIQKRVLLKVKSIESKLYKYIDLLWVCSDRDAALFRKSSEVDFLQIDVIPNGTNIPKKINIMSKFDMKLKPNILFVGSLDYKPNEEGLIWFIENVLVDINGEFDFLIIGSGNPSEKLKFVMANDSRVRFLGYVQNLGEYYYRSNVVVIPILSGSGTRLKALEALSYGCVIVSTSKGIEGIQLENEIIIENEVIEMAHAIQYLLENPNYGNEMRRKSRVLVEKYYDWNIIGNKINSSIEYCFNNTFTK